MAHPSETPYVQPSSGIADGIARKVMLFGILAIFLLINVIVLYALHFTSAGVPASASNVKVSSDAFKVGAIDKKVVSFGDDGSIVVGAGTTGYLDAVAMPNDAINYITLAPIGANASSTAILAYYLKNKTTTVITTLTINDDKTTTVSTKQSTAANVQVRGIATLSNSQAVFLQSTAMGKTSLVPGSDCKFSANPRKVFSSIVLYTSQVEPEPSKVLRTLITHSGGQVLSHPSRSATHMLCLRPEGDAFQQALNWDAEGATLQTDTLSDEDVLRAATSYVATNVHGPIPDSVLAYIIGQSHLTKHRIVNYLWIYECIRVNQLLPESLYGFEHNHKPSGAQNVTLSDVVMALQRDSQLFPPVTEALPLDIWKDISQNAAKEWADNAFVVATHIATGLRQRMLEAIQGLGAKVVVLEDDVDDRAMDGVTYVVCAHQTGREFHFALARGKTIVGLQWLAASLALRTLLPANFDGKLLLSSLQPL
ncbi:hypothetical protein SPRG_22264 [Saprolegnia parasitica CBS 223.65]|uniref:BRCT domain-containing protein n=1 Tax=Saprolegnia parasitica (strain CBS 223.65) TaxID=695850 RepID=A0A067C350_SAPPC|nr:hypothetical protein SPRG_22264 [Saprolegnia parasitica CBS 223.65]KDO23570.1 hypothetical protein SPRG_22264 [Saprolegnia parasitica CBS 223.65]|eukprot:XP_012205766.1 hypothetical protein SPRG_22264 [Saprolegnia parasitica CBS 223.65]